MALVQPRYALDDETALPAPQPEWRIETFRQGTGKTGAELAAVNQVIATAIDSWGLPPRVRRLAGPALAYTEADLADLEFAVAKSAADVYLGIAAWYDPDFSVGGPPTVFLHGVYVRPEHQGRTIGKALLGAVAARAAEQGADTLTVKAWRESLPFFRQCGFEMAHGWDETFPAEMVKRLEVTS